MIVFECHPRVNGALVKMIEFLQLFDDMLLDGPGQPDVVRRKYQFHASKMQSEGEKIQFFLGFWVVGYFRAKWLKLEYAVLSLGVAMKAGSISLNKFFGVVSFP
jgi:hypothetical protein